MRGHHTAFGWVSLSVLAVTCAGACSSPTAPSRPPMTSSSVVVTNSNVNGIRIAGRAFDQDSKAAIAGAVVTITQLQEPGRFYIPSGMPTTTTTDAGEFELKAPLPAEWQSVQLGLTAAGYEPANVYVSPAEITAAVLPVYATVVLRPGTTVDASISLTHYVCGWESYWCRRFVVEAPVGELVDVEVTSVIGGLVGLITTDEPFPFSGYQQRVTVPAGAIWMVGGPSTVTLTTRKH